ncbi:MAG: hypothetical protein FWF97_03175 [Alphaproteobacteria bacterium]|nr:hypothetical protein [Alphaproteobacteria bacterium]
MSGFFIPDYMLIDGGVPVSGTVRISGAKNEVLGAMAAAVLTDQPVTLRNVPHIADVLNMGVLMEKLGIDVRYNPDSGEMRIHAQKIKTNILSDEAYAFRASYYIWGALLARFRITGEWDGIVVPKPGGCKFGARDRGIDFHLGILSSVLGVTDTMDDVGLKLELTGEPAPAPNIFSTAKPSHGATFQWMLAAAGADGIQAIYNAAQEPEVAHLMHMLNAMGMKLRGGGHTAIISKPRKPGLLHGGEFKIMPDRLETGFYALLACATRGKISLQGIHSESCKPWLNSLIEQMGGAGVKRGGWLKTHDNSTAMDMDFSGRGKLPGMIMLCSPFLGKETDMHQIWAPVMADSAAPTVFLDPIWEGRSKHFPELAKFGLKSEFEVRETNIKYLSATVFPSELHSASAQGMDLRGTAALVIAAAMSPGQSKISLPDFALRGFPDMVKKLQNIGLGISESETGHTMQPLAAL